MQSSEYLNYDRVGYNDIKAFVLDAYYHICRDKGVVSKMTHYEVSGYVSYEFENTYERPIELLMLQVVLLILNGDWYPEQSIFYRAEYNKIIENNDGLDNLLSKIPSEEAALFRHDLEIIGFL